MLPQEIIRRKRDGEALTAAEIAAFVDGIAAGTVSEGQIGAFCMAVVLKKMDRAERVALTSAMAHSGRTMTWDLPGPVLDKHSTGGVGDKPSLIIAPLVAACGGYVPMIAGRGLGHTGGTLDKMDSIPGYVSQPEAALFEKTVRDAGCAIIGATHDLAPADRAMYAVRDVTATVESLDLITASILSKKLAAGLQGLVMDVKFGSGAFLPAYADAQALADSIVQVAKGAGLPAVALLTDMNQILGRAAGNALEVREAVDYLKNMNVDPRLHAVTAALAAEMLVLGGLAEDTAEARIKVNAALTGGQAAEHFARMVAALGGPADFIEKPEKYLKFAPVIMDVRIPGRIAAMDVHAIGLGIVELGGGRAKPSDTIDPAVGLSDAAGIGEEAHFTIHARDEDGWRRMAATLERAVKTGEELMKTGDPVKQRIGD
jgi:thymidine phosphorylase